jgi:hypothetical protein
VLNLKNADQLLNLICDIESENFIKYKYMNLVMFDDYLINSVISIMSYFKECEQSFHGLTYFP